jgi:hypothetical protein
VHYLVVGWPVGEVKAPRFSLKVHRSSPKGVVTSVLYATVVPFNDERGRLFLGCSFVSSHRGLQGS